MTEEMITSRKSKLFWNFYRRTNASWLETWLSEILCPIFTRYWQSAQHNRKICIPLELFKKKLFDTVYYLRFLSSFLTWHQNWVSWQKNFFYNSEFLYWSRALRLNFFIPCLTKPVQSLANLGHVRTNRKPNFLLCYLLRIKFYS